MDNGHGALVTPHGVISLHVNKYIRYYEHNSFIRQTLIVGCFRVDITIDRAVRITNDKNCIVLALSSTGSSATMFHLNGTVYQYGSRVEILAYDSQGKNHK